MKKYLILFFVCFVLSESLFAVLFTDGLFMYGGTVTGPVKEVTVILSQNNYPSDRLTSIAWFDSIGRIEKAAHYRDGKSVGREIYQYSDSNTCWLYSYDENDKIFGYIYEFYFDSVGRQTMRFSYNNDKLSSVDSLVYDTRGNVIEKHVSPYYERTPILQIAYTYDSIGRLIKEYDYQQQNGYTITYLPNGNYTKHFFDKTGNTKNVQCIVNKAGQLTREKSASDETIYSHFDRYGNWLKRDCNLDTHSIRGRIGSTTERVIKYYK